MPFSEGTKVKVATWENLVITHKDTIKTWHGSETVTVNEGTYLERQDLDRLASCDEVTILRTSSAGDRRLVKAWISSYTRITYWVPTYLLSLISKVRRS